MIKFLISEGLYSSNCIYCIMIVPNL